jgi:hypothetical protein
MSCVRCAIVDRAALVRSLSLVSLFPRRRVLTPFAPVPLFSASIAHRRARQLFGAGRPVAVRRVAVLGGTTIRGTTFRGAAAIVALTLVGCARSTLPTPIPERPTVSTPVEVPAPPPPRVVSYTIPATVNDTRYRLESQTTLERDSAGRRESQDLTSRAQANVRLRRTPTGGFTATGTVSAYQVSSALSTMPIAIDSLRFDAVLDSLSLRVVSSPPLANECDRAETGALGLVRDVLLRIPTAVTIGERWRDSTVQVVCRSSVPMVVRTSSEYVVSDVERDGDQMILLVRRTSVSRVSGTTSSPWRSVEVTGSGDGSLEARVALSTGAVQRVRGTSTLTLMVTDRTVPTHVRSQQVRQRVTLSVNTIP